MKPQESCTERLNATAMAAAAISHDILHKEQAEARGHYFTQLLLPHLSDLPAYIALRDKIELLERRALMDLSLSTKARIELYDQADELRREMDSIDQRIIAERDFPNVVATVGKNLALDTYLAGSSYTVTGPYIGLISSSSYSAVAAADTMSSHGGWLEAGDTNAPTYSGTRKTASWSAASSGSKALSSASSFSITGTGTVKGAFMAFGSGASTTIGNTSGTLYSAGLFSGGDQPVVNGNTLNVSYSTSL
jgi:hypothetical protein